MANINFAGPLKYRTISSNVMDARTSSQFWVCFLVYLTVHSDLLNYKELNKRMIMKIN